MSQLELFKESEIREPEPVNAMVRELGRGPKGTTCEECRHHRQNVCKLTRVVVLKHYESCRMYKAANR